MASLTVFEKLINSLDKSQSNYQILSNLVCNQTFLNAYEKDYKKSQLNEMKTKLEREDNVDIKNDLFERINDIDDDCFFVLKDVIKKQIETFETDNTKFLIETKLKISQIDYNTYALMDKEFNITEIPEELLRDIEFQKKHNNYINTSKKIKGLKFNLRLLNFWEENKNVIENDYHMINEAKQNKILYNKIKNQLDNDLFDEKLSSSKAPLLSSTSQLKFSDMGGSPGLDLGFMNIEKLYSPDLV